MGKKANIKIRYLNHNWTAKGRMTDYPTKTTIEKQFIYNGEIILKLPILPKIKKDKEK